jgi:hypothetical protein
VENDFPHLPAGCSIQFDRLSQKYVLENIRTNLKNLAVQVPERLETFTADTGQDLTFGNFIRYHDYEPERLLVAETWSGWKARARLVPVPSDPDLGVLKKTLIRAASVSGPSEIRLMRACIGRVANGDVISAAQVDGNAMSRLYHRLWPDTGSRYGFRDFADALQRLSENPSILGDMDEILEWAANTSPVSGIMPELPFSCSLELHALYSIKDIQAALGKADLATAGQRGVGVLHINELKTYALLITFQKTEKEFSPSTMYADYPVSRKLMHWESQSSTTRRSATGQNLIDHKERGYTILIFARSLKKQNGCTVPFTYLGPAERVRYESEKPIKMIWQLRHAMPVEMFEENRRGG